jgi:transposase
VRQEPIGVPRKETRSMKTNTPGGRRGLSADLSERLGERAVLKLVLDAVQTLDRRTLEAEAGRTPGFRPQMLLTLLAYCYATRRYGSRDIEWAMTHDRMVRYICAHVYPDWCLLRRFRRRNRERLVECLTLVFQQAWAMETGGNEMASLGFDWFEEIFHEQVRAEVLNRLDLAALHDVESD